VERVSSVGDLEGKPREERSHIMPRPRHFARPFEFAPDVLFVLPDGTIRKSVACWLLQHVTSWLLQYVTCWLLQYGICWLMQCATCTLVRRV